MKYSGKVTGMLTLYFINIMKNKKAFIVLLDEQPKLLKVLNSVHVLNMKYVNSTF